MNENNVRGAFRDTNNDPAPATTSDSTASTKKSKVKVTVKKAGKVTRPLAAFHSKSKSKSKPKP